MKRRALLASLGAGASLFSGCQGLRSDAQTTPSTPTAPDPRTASDCEFRGRRTASLVETGPVPSAAGLAIDATLDLQEITANQTARLTVTVTNTGATRTTTLADEEYCHLFDRTRSLSSNGLRLFRQQDAPPVDEGDCWRRDKDPSETQTSIDIGCREREFEADESVSTTYEVWSYYDEDEYFPPGTHHFSTTITLWQPDDDDSRETFDWWLELDIVDQ